MERMSLPHLTVSSSVVIPFPELTFDIRRLGLIAASNIGSRVRLRLERAEHPAPWNGTTLRLHLARNESTVTKNFLTRQFDYHDMIT
jgi:hypothetical protein